jgi:DNA-binding response OmpR family regulator
MTDKKMSAAEKPGSAPLQCRPGSPPRILVVDDEPDISRSTAQTLAGSGFQIDAAEDGAAAWDTLQLNSYDLLITDHNMPKLTGVELVRKLRSAQIKLPVNNAL